LSTCDIALRSFDEVAGAGVRAFLIVSAILLVLAPVSLLFERYEKEYPEKERRWPDDYPIELLQFDSDHPTLFHRKDWQAYRGAVGTGRTRSSAIADMKRKELQGVHSAGFSPNKNVHT
jgi:hypothetical protein